MLTLSFIEIMRVFLYVKEALDEGSEYHVSRPFI